MRGVAGATAALLLGALILAASPWWPAGPLCGALPETPLCARPGMFGVEALHWRGNWVARWLRGGPLAESALLVWAVGTVLLLSLSERALAALRR